MLARFYVLGIIILSLSFAEVHAAAPTPGESCRVPRFDAEYFVYRDVRGPFVVSDWNEDRLPDIVTLNAHELRLHRNVGRFQLRSDGVIPVGVTGAAGLARDLDRDGHDDLIIVGPEGTFTFRGDGLGRFVATATYPVPGGALAAGDLNGDGTTDLIVMGDKSLSIIFVEQASYRLWTTPVSYSTSVALADFDRDGDLDMTTSGAGITIWINDGSGQFGTPISCACDFGISSVAVGDFNHDGNVDAVGTDEGPEGCGLIVVYGHGNGTFTDCAQLTQMAASKPPVVLEPLHVPYQPHFVLAADLTRDGFEELIPLEREGGLEVMGHRSVGGTTAEAVDMDGDGLVDVVAGGYILVVHPGTGTGIRPQSFLAYGRYQGPPRLHDLDRDGRLDVVGSHDDAFFALLTDADGALNRMVQLPCEAGIYSDALADFNGDGVLDALRWDGVFLGRLDLTFGELVPFPVSLSKWAVGDLNGDRKPDIVASNEVILLGNGDGTFGVSEDGVSFSGQFQLVDLDRDGHLDLLVGGATLSIFYGRGDGTFEPAVHQAWKLADFATADVNLDGFIDIVTARGQVVIVQGRSWTIMEGFAEGAEPAYHLTAGNFNGDVWPDLALAAYGSYTWVLAGRGDGTFSETGVAFGPRGYLVANDQNRDGLDEVITASIDTEHGEGDITVVKNVGGQNLVPDVTAAVGSIQVAWPPSGEFVPVTISGVKDPEGDPTTIVATAITMDEPPSPNGRSGSCPSAAIEGNVARIRLERDGNGNGRVYSISFTASDPCGGSSQGTVTVCVPHDHGHSQCVDDGQRYSALECDGTSHEKDETPEPILVPRRIRPGVVALSVPGDLSRDASIEVYDLAGRRVAQLMAAPSGGGRREAVWDGSDLKRGVYFARLRSNQSTWTRTVVLLP